MKNYIILGIALLAGITAFMVSKRQIDSEYNRMATKYQQVQVVVFAKDAIKGDVIREDAIAGWSIFRRDATGEEVLAKDYRDVLGLRLGRDVKRAVPIRWADLQVAGRRKLGGSELARLVPDKLRALAIPVDTTSSVSGMVQPNDHVDIIGSFRFPDSAGQGQLDTITLTLLQNVTILAVGQKLATSRGTPDDSASRLAEASRTYANLTVDVTPKEAEMLVFAMQKGKLTFTLRNPEDPYVEDNVQDVDWRVLEKNLKVYTQERKQRMSQQQQQP